MYMIAYTAVQCVASFDELFRYSRWSCMHECLMAMVNEALTSISSASVSRPENWHSTELIAALTPFPDGNWLGCKIAA